VAWQLLARSLAKHGGPFEALPARRIVRHLGDLSAQGKGELIESLPDDGVAVLNASDPRVLAMARRTRARVVTFGEGGDVVAGDVVLRDDLTSTFTAKTPWGNTTVDLGARGAHNIDNALAALAVAAVCGVALDAAAVGLRTPRWSPWRMELHSTRGGARVINDSYNANPTSMAAALRALAAVPARRPLRTLSATAADSYWLNLQEGEGEDR